jgi:NAD(P)-dependent dehydrogenase (short-subunit alcohol dehydrogenase family)
MQLDGLDGRVALVTGAAQGIGRRICERLVEQGARVAGMDLREPEIDGVLGLTGDVTDAGAIDAVFTRVEDELGTVQVLVLNAGVFIVAPFEQTTREQWDLQIAVNLTGPFLCAQRALGPMAASGYGRVVTVGSSAGVTGGANSCAAYAASKAGVMTLAKSIANEYARTGVRANAVAPTLIDTAMMESQPADIAERIPVGRLGTPDDIAGLVCFLCSEHASYITGEVVDINGGFLVD